MTKRQAGPWALVLCLVATAAWAQQPAQQPEQRTVKGTVVDALTGEGVPLATITIKGTRIGVTAEVDGSFTFPAVPQGPVTLHFFSPDHQTKDVLVGANQDTVRVEL